MNASAAGGDGTSWTNAFTDLQGALAAAVSGDEIWVAAGTYTPTNSSDRLVSFVLKSGVALYGGFAGGEKALRERSLDPGLTILSGDIGTIGDDTDNSFHVVYADGVTGAVLDGFTVTGGRGEGINGSSHAGAGMYNYESSLTVANCTFKDNQVAVKTSNGTGRGGGMYNYKSAPIVRNCAFIGNQAGHESIGYGGGMYNYGHFGSDQDPQWPVITGCTFNGNIRSGSAQDFKIHGGGGMYNDYCSPTVDRCTFAGNYSSYCGGAMHNHGAGSIIITNCIFTANHNKRDGKGGAILNYGSGSKILNCTFYRNGWSRYHLPPYNVWPFASEGGAIAHYLSGGIIANSLFVENASFSKGGALFVQSILQIHRPTLYNCLFYENIRWNPLASRVEEIGPYSSHVDGFIQSDSVNNLFDIDPLLVDASGGNFRLRYDSPGIDSGTTLKFATIRWLPMPATDFDGNTRFKDGDVDGETAADIGAYEYVPNLPDLHAFLQALADSGDLDEVTAARLLAYVDEAQAALDREEEQTAIRILNELIADAWASLGNTATAQIIEMKTLAVIEEI